MKRNTPRHPKVYEFMQALELPVRSRPLAVGYLELLWHFTAEFAPQGDIGRYSDDRIESALDWHGKRGKLIAALTTSRWCDKSDRHRLVVHDWHEHADDSVRKRLARAGLKFLSLADEVTEQCPQPCRTSADNVRLPEPEPVPKPVPVPAPPPRAPAPEPTVYDFEERYERLYAQHVIPGFHHDGKHEYQKILAEAVNPERQAELIDAGHAEWMAYFRANPEVYRPGIGKWLHDGYYARKPAGGAGARADPAADRKRRVLELARQQEEQRGNRNRPSV
jgi:hypothetical protein